MAINATLVGAGTSATSSVSSSSGTTTTGSNFAICIAWDNGANVSASNPTDSKSNTYTSAGSEQLDGNGGRLRWFYCLNGTGGATHSASCNFSATAFASISLYEITGSDTSAIQQATQAQDSGGQPFTITSGALSSGNWCLLAAASNNTGSDGAYTANASTPTATLLHSEGTVSSFWTHGVSVMLSSGTSAVTPSFNRSGTSGGTSAMSLIVFNETTDSTAPVLTSPTGTATGSTTANVGATTDEGNGTMYAVVTTSITTPSVAQIKASQDHTGAAAVWGGNQAIGSAGAKTLNATGLSPSTGYYGHIVHADAANNDSNRVTSSQFTTNAPSVDNQLAWIRA